MRHKTGDADVFVVTSGGVVIRDERARCDDLMARSAPPPECGPEMIAAPARGPMVAMSLRDVVRGEDGRARVITTGFSGRKPARCADAFDMMERDHRRAHKRAGGKGDTVPLFTVGQVEAGREYAALVERVNSSGLSCASMEAAGRGGGSGGGVQDAILRDIERLRLLRHRVGAGLAREVRRFRQGDGRRAIRCLTLVDMVCVEGKSVEAVLKAHGWAVDAKCRAALRDALCGALDRMRGYGLVRTTR